MSTAGPTSSSRCQVQVVDDPLDVMRAAAPQRSAMTRPLKDRRPMAEPALRFARDEAVRKSPLDLDLGQLLRELRPDRRAVNCAAVGHGSAPAGYRTCPGAVDRARLRLPSRSALYRMRAAGPALHCGP
jgi:hypothetical protein